MSLFDRASVAALAGLLLALAPGFAAAQTDPLPPSDAARALADLAEDTATEDRQPAAEPPRTAPGPVAAPPAPPVPPPPFTIRRITFDGPSGYLDAERLSAVTRPFLGRRLPLAQLPLVAEAINGLYAAEGIVLAEALISVLDPATGTLSLDLFEARLGRIDYVSDRASAAYLSWRTGLRSGELADTRRIETRLQRLFLTDGPLADVDFAPGAAVGTTDVTVTLVEPPAVTTTVQIDSFGEAASGTTRLLFGTRISSLTGAFDPLTADLLLTEGARSVSLSYARTVTPEGGRVSAVLSGQRIENITGPERVSETSSATVSYAHPLVLTPRSRLWGSVSADAFDERTRTAGIVTADQEGWALTAALDGAFEPEDGGLEAVSWSAAFVSGSYRDGVLGGGARAHRSLTFSGRADIRPGEAVRLVASGAAQLALTDDTPSRYLFTVTSPFAVPGYEPGLSAGDSGWWVRLQGETAEPLDFGGLASVTPFGFVAMGEAFDRIDGEVTGQGGARSAGLGMTARLGQGLDMSLVAARPLTDVLGDGGDGDWSLDASLSVRF